MRISMTPRAGGAAAPRVLTARRTDPVLVRTRDAFGTHGTSQPLNEMDRLDRIRLHLSGAGAPTIDLPIESDPSSAVHAGKHRLLSDAQVREFITRGVLTLPVSDLSPDFHAKIHSEAERMFSKGISLGNDILPGVAGLQEVLDSPTVSGGLTSLLGPGYALHPHRHMHQSTTQGDQTFHKDSQRGRVKGFRPRWVMCLYVPAGATDQMGATAVVPQSQYLANDGLGAQDSSPMQFTGCVSPDSRNTHAYRPVICTRLAWWMPPIGRQGAERPHRASTIPARRKVHHTAPARFSHIHARKSSPSAWSLDLLSTTRSRPMACTQTVCSGSSTSYTAGRRVLLRSI